MFTAIILNVFATLFTDVSVRQPRKNFPVVQMVQVFIQFQQRIPYGQTAAELDSCNIVMVLSIKLLSWPTTFVEGVLGTF